MHIEVILYSEFKTLLGLKFTLRSSVKDDLVMLLGLSSALKI